jgi:hypothetical protein
MSHLGKIVEIKEVNFLVLKRFKVMNDPLYLSIYLNNDPVLSNRNYIWTLKDTNNKDWYPKPVPMVLSDQMLEKLDAKAYVDEDIANSLIFDQAFFVNAIKILGEITIPLLSRKYPREQCIEVYNHMIQELLG